MSDDSDDSVVLFARKTLENNTRIFKQAETLTEEGYTVTLIGIKSSHLPREEEQEGYTIIRVGKITPDQTRLWNILKKLIPLYLVYIAIKWLVIQLFTLFGFLSNTIGQAANRISRSRTHFSGQKTTQEDRPIFRNVQKPVRVVQQILNRFVDRILRRLLIHGRWFLLSYNYYTKSYRAVKERSLDPNFVQANDLNTLIVAIFTARNYEVPLYYDAQELYTEIHKLPRWYKYILTIQEFVLIRFANRVTAVNPFISEVIERRYRTTVDDVLLNCPPFDPVDGDDMDTRPGTTAREKFDIAPDIPVVLYSGGLSTQRGLKNLIEAMADIPDAVLVILGEGPLREELEEMAVELCFADRVYFSDFVPHEEVPAFITSADIGVVPYEHVGMNHYLCSPSKLFHYIMAELVIVGSEFPFLERVIKSNDIGGTFDPDDPESMTAAIEAIVTDSARLERHRENVAEAKYRYTWENEAEKFLAQYEAMHGRDADEPEVSREGQANSRTVEVTHD